MPVCYPLTIVRPQKIETATEFRKRLPTVAVQYPVQTIRVSTHHDSDAASINPLKLIDIVANIRSGPPERLPECTCQNDVLPGCVGAVISVEVRVQNSVHNAISCARYAAISLADALIDPAGRNRMFQ
jgi:hypothetical protein